MQATATRAIRNIHRQGLLTTADGAVIRHWPVQLGQIDEALHKANGLTQWQAEQAFDGQAKLDGGIAECGGPTRPARGLGQPNHVSVKPDGQGASGLEGSVVVFPIGGAVLSGSGFGHGAQATRWLGLCNSAVSDAIVSLIFNIVSM